MKYDSDIVYIEKVLSGNINAFSHLIDRHQHKTFNLAFRICGNREEAEEIAQDSFLKAFRSLKYFRKKSSFATWLYRIVYNTSITYIRNRGKRVLSLEEFPADVSDFLVVNENPDEAIDLYRESLLNFALQKLQEEERGLVTLYYYDELGLNEIASITGIKKQNLKVKLFRVRQRMAEIIKTAERKKALHDE